MAVMPSDGRRRAVSDKQVSMAFKRAARAAKTEKQVFGDGPALAA
jgi:hypothetical protein